MHEKYYLINLCIQLKTLKINPAPDYPKNNEKKKNNRQSNHIDCIFKL